MSEERNKVLEMVAEGKISAQDAAKLLDKLENLSGGAGIGNGTTGTVAAATGKTPRYLRIVVEKPNEDHVNIRVPLAFARSGAKLMSVIPPRMAERLAHQGIDLDIFSRMRDDNVDEVLRELNMEIEKGNGKKIRVYCE